MDLQRLAATALLTTTLSLPLQHATAQQTQPIHQHETQHGFVHYDSNVKHPSDAQVLLLGEQHNTPKNGLGQLIAKYTGPGTQILHEKPPGSYLDSLDFRDPEGMKELLGSAVMQNQDKWQPVYSKDHKAFTMYGIDSKRKQKVGSDLGAYFMNVIARDYLNHGCQNLHPYEQESITQITQPRRADETLDEFVERGLKARLAQRDSTKKARQQEMEERMMTYVENGDPTIVVVGRGHIDGQTGSSLLDPLKQTTTYYSFVEPRTQNESATQQNMENMYHFVKAHLKRLDKNPSAYRERFDAAFDLPNDTSKAACQTAR